MLKIIKHTTDYLFKVCFRWALSSTSSKNADLLGNSALYIVPKQNDSYKIRLVYWNMDANIDSMLEFGMWSTLNNVYLSLTPLAWRAV